MPAPTNISAATATDLGTLPADATQNVHDAGTTYTVWYKFTAPSTYYVGVFGFGDLATYTPTLFVWYGNASSPSLLFDSGIEAHNLPCQFPVTGGETYYLQFITNAGNPTPAVLTLNVQMHVASAVPTGQIFVPDDNSNFWAATLSTTAQTVLRFDDFPAGESMFLQLANGYILTEDIEDDSIKLYSAAPPNGTLIATITGYYFLTATSGGWISGNKSDTFYVSDADSPTFTVRTVDLTGAFGPTTWGPIGSSSSTRADAICVSPDETILYYGNDVNTIIRRWNLTTNTALSNLTAGPGGNYLRRRQMICLADGTVIAMFTRTVAGGGLSVLAIRYNTDGTVANTYDFTSLTDGANLRDNQIQLALDDPTSFWVWIKESQGVSSFRNVRVSDGVILTTVPDHRQYETGIYVGATTATPDMRFGHSESCPFVVLPAAVEESGGSGNQIDCPHGSFTPNILQKSGSYLRTMNRLQGTYETGFTGTGSDTRTFRPKQGTYEPTMGTRTGSF